MVSIVNTVFKITLDLHLIKVLIIIHDLTCDFPRTFAKKLLDVSTWVSTVGIYAECYALSPEEPRHYNQSTSETPAYKISSLFQVH